MSDASADIPPANATATSSPALRLRRGWLVGCIEENRLPRFLRDRFPACRNNGVRTWCLSEGETFLAAFFDLDTAKRIRDAANRCADFLSVNELCARVCEEHPSNVDIGLFHGEDFVHLFELEPALALDLLMSLLESLETVMKDPANADRFTQLGHPLFSSLPSQSLKDWRASEATVTMHPMLHEIRTSAPLSLTLEMLLRDLCFEGMPESFISQLLIDLRHFCDAYQLDFRALDHVAHGRYLEERSGAANTAASCHTWHDLWNAEGSEGPVEGHLRAAGSIDPSDHGAHQWHPASPESESGGDGTHGAERGRSERGETTRRCARAVWGKWSV